MELALADWPCEAIGDRIAPYAHEGEKTGLQSLLTSAIGDYCAEQPSSVLYLLPTEPTAVALLSTTSSRLDSSPTLQGRLMSPAVAGMTATPCCTGFGLDVLKVVAGKAPRNLRRHDCRVLLIDEADAIAVSAEGDPIRSQSAGP